MPPEIAETAAERNERMKPTRERLAVLSRDIIEIGKRVPQFERHDEAVRLLHIAAADLLGLGD